MNYEKKVSELTQLVADKRNLEIRIAELENSPRMDIEINGFPFVEAQLSTPSKNKIKKSFLLK